MFFLCNRSQINVNILASPSQAIISSSAGRWLTSDLCFSFPIKKQLVSQGMKQKEALRAMASQMCLSNRTQSSIQVGRGPLEFNRDFHHLHYSANYNLAK